ncbi:two-component sensor histidine kinase [Arsenicicoccus piscis]|uniref:Two-component sensor histidine kinase n=2 Tax=Arsenicicoccus piscis TaxID=673954 RepID=A0ABQ6HMD9_9MICO|nr:two-component sensor histidine kinase [Arsenicicoccus piscis]
MGSASVQRSAAVLVWTPVLLAQPLLDRGQGPDLLVSVLLVALAAAACAVSVLDSWPSPRARTALACTVLVAVVTLGSTQWSSWAPAWLLAAMTAGVALRPRVALVVVPLCALLAGATTAHLGAATEAVLTQAFVVALAGTTAAVIGRLVATTEALRRTRLQLADLAVEQERDRVARDLHDVLGHTLSVMVVKAVAVRRLVRADPDAATRHAQDIESIGRTALNQVRDTIHNTSAPTLRDELAAADEALSSAGIEVVLPDVVDPPQVADEPLAWALREAVTNLLRHSVARRCRVELTTSGDRCRLTVADDGTGGRGGASRPPGGHGGLVGLRQRLEAVGGGLTVTPGSEGFTLTAWVPTKEPPR